MKVTVIGTGYVGLVTGACLASVGNKVICVDNDSNKINSLKSVNIPFFEPGLEDLVKENTKSKNLSFSLNHTDESLSSDVFFIAVGTPQDVDGSVNMQFVKQAAIDIGKGLNKDSTIVNKSTISIGSTSEINELIQKELDKRNSNIQISVVANPEFLREGSAITDFMEPERVIIGSEIEAAVNLLKLLYQPFITEKEQNFYVMDTKSAELTKYAANAMLATRISFMNEMALISEKLGADINLIKLGIGSDSRIGNKFLNAGMGYGGSCFPKDLNGLIYSADQLGIDLNLIKAVQKVNEYQKNILYLKLQSYFNSSGGLNKKRLALWGLSYKSGTDDVREASSINLLRSLKKSGAKVKAFDPMATSNMRDIFPEHKDLSYVKAASDALEDAEALIICTEWSEFIDFPFKKFTDGNLKYILDGRNCLSRESLISKGFIYEGIGR